MGHEVDLRRALPSVDELLRDPQARAALSDLDRPLAVELARQAIEAVRRSLALREVGRGVALPENIPGQVVRELEMLARHRRAERIQPVINATGIVLHTNLGRAPLPQAALEFIAAVASGYSNLELDVESGRRGSRTARLLPLLLALTGAEAAFVVNNNAAAVLLALAATSHGREVVISRGELIEIGDSFRLPDVIAQSGCKLKEVGATNRTRLADYEAALTDDTTAVLKANPSNYRIVGFTESVAIEELAGLCRRRNVLLLVDVGSGVLGPRELRRALAPARVTEDRDPWLPETAWLAPGAEPTVQEAIAAGADAVMFSGDKLLGGPQAGIIVGRQSVVDRIRRHPLARALRVGKLTIAALTAVLELYAKDRLEEIPLWALLSTPVASLMERARRIVAAIDARPHSAIRAEAVLSQAEIGGGSFPATAIASAAVILVAPPDRSELASRLTSALRDHVPPVIGRAQRCRVVLDLRTVLPSQDELVISAVRQALAPL